MSVYFYYGDEDYNIERAIETLKKGLDKNFSAMNYKVVDNPSYPDLISALRTQGMMFGKMLTVINCKSYFDKSFEDSQIKEIESALENNLENSDIVFVVKLPRNEKKKLDSRKKLFKVLSKFNVQEFPTFQLNYYGKQDLSQWIKKEAKSKGITLEQAVIDMLIEQIGNNLRELDSELDKLKLTAYPQKNITLDMVREICISNEDIFAFAELVMSGEVERAIIEYKKLLDKKHPLEILSLIQTTLRKRILLKTNSEKSTEEIAVITGMSPKQVMAIMRNSKNQKLKNLVQLKKNFTDAEYRIKAGLSANPESEVEYAIMR